MTTQQQTHNQGERVYQSRIGKRPIALPKGVTASVKDGSVEIKGPKGTLTRELPPNVNLKVDGGVARSSRRPSRAATARASRGSPGRSSRHGRRRGRGLHEDASARRHRLPRGAQGHSRSTSPSASRTRSSSRCPQGVKCEIPGDSKGTLLILTGSDKEVMGQTAAKIRGFRPPEPYGGKGVRYQGEKVREKAGKAAKAGGK